MRKKKRYLKSAAFLQHNFCKKCLSFHEYLIDYITKESNFISLTACSWNNKLYYDGDHWKENGVDFYCTSSHTKSRPGCYVENGQLLCTGAIPGWYHV